MLEREAVLQVVLKNFRRHVEGLEGRDLDPGRSMLDLGASSLDVVEIVSDSMRELQVRVPRTELAGLKNINGLVDLLHTVQRT